MLTEELRIFRQHGQQSIASLKDATVPGPFRGRPVIAPGNSPEEETKIAAICPAGAIATGPLSIDLGKCTFCEECQFFAPAVIRFSNDYRMAAGSREKLIIRAGEEKEINVKNENTLPFIHQFFRRALKLRQVSAGGDNATEMELNATGNVNFDLGRYGIEFVASPRHADGMVITGPITRNMAAAVKLTWEAIPSPKILILAGTDAISGGLFLNSTAIDRSFLTDRHIDLFVPGNPVHPLTFIHGIMELTGRW